jgi:hypothetical protein
MEESEQKLENQELSLEFKRKELEDQDLMRDSHRQMAWISLISTIMYPSIIMISYWSGFPEAGKTLGTIAGPYFLAVAAIVMAFMGVHGIKPKTTRK